MKRILSVAFIVCYVSALTYGNVCHLLRHGTVSHTMMYMIVWDMFCGWSAYDSRVHLIAEGESETYYDLSHPPWGELHAFGYISRENYDPFNSHTGTIGLNVLKHTRHEPITRILVIEESWPKKLNLPDAIWNLRYDNPKDRHSYFRVRTILLPDGTITKQQDSFLSCQARKLSTANPRLAQDAFSGRPLFLNEGNGEIGRDLPVGPGASRISAPSAQ
ncbi:MAG: hypothetical protein HY290_29965 [Planctomycetia bacterium]|nr:hypothetical protein [Planctomycetia bacterium]